MKTIAISIILALLSMLNITESAPAEGVIAVGQQPQIASDNNGNIRIIYGHEDKIYCATSFDRGSTFPDIQLVGEVGEMHLGMSRGPQVASSKHYTLVSAIDRKGDIHTFRLDHQSGIWEETGLINDLPGSAPEGLMGIAADRKDHFYAVWLDIRNNKRNKICFASTKDKGTTWSKNQIIYQSPEGTVCECCKPNIAVSQSKIYIMFRNWLDGSRDLYLVQSDNNGASFSDAMKLGEGTWKLNACPMDGGGLVVGENGKVLTVWQRAGKIYLAEPSKEEILLETGRNCSIADPEDPVVTWQDGNKLKALELNGHKDTVVGEGSFIKTARTSDGNILLVWEKEGSIVFRSLASQD
jgi:hypothetical protein